MIPRSTLILPMLALLAACRPAVSQTATPTPAHAPTRLPTGTPSPTALPSTATPTPRARAFTEDFNQAPSDWSFLQVDNGQPARDPSAAGGFLVFELAGPNQWIYSIYAGPDYGDVLVEAQIQLRTPGDGAAGLVCRYSERQGWYELDIYGDQTYQLLYGQWLRPGVARYTPLYGGQSEKIDADSDEIGLLCDGNTLTPIINGTQLRRWQEGKFNLQAGKIGVSASSFEDAPFRIAYDWVRVSEP